MENYKHRQKGQQQNAKFLRSVFRRPRSGRSQEFCNSYFLPYSQQHTSFLWDQTFPNTVIMSARLAAVIMAASILDNFRLVCNEDLIE